MSSMSGSLHGAVERVPVSAEEAERARAELVRNYPAARCPWASAKAVTMLANGDHAVIFFVVDVAEALRVGIAEQIGRVRILLEPVGHATLQHSRARARSAPRSN